MATSGSHNYRHSRDSLLKSSLRLIGAIVPGETPDAQIITDAAESLNDIIKDWQKYGIHLWKIKKKSFTLTSGTASYTLGKYLDPTVSFDTADVNTTTEVITTNSNHGYSDGDRVEVSSTGTVPGGLSANTEYYVISSTANTLQLSTSSGGSAIDLTSVGTGTHYLQKINSDIYMPRPLDVFDMFIRDTSGSSNIDIPVARISRQEYSELSNKASSGVSTQYLYDRQTPQANLYLWPVVNDSNHEIHFNYSEPFEDMDSTDDDFDFPDTWYRALKWELAAELGMEYGITNKQQNMLEAKAARILGLTLSWDQEQESIYIQPDYEGRME